MAMPVSRVVKLMLAVIVLMVVLLINENTLDATKDAVKKIFVSTEITIGDKNLTGSKPTLHPEHEKRLDKLHKTMKEMAQSKETECIRNYKGLIPMEGVNTILSSDGNQIVMRVKSGEGGLQDAKVYAPIPASLCVIAGEIEGENVAKNFYDKMKTQGKFITAKNYYKPTSSIFIQGGTEVAFEGITAELKDQGLLYKAPEGNICFFPTYSSFMGFTKHAQEGLEEDQLDADEIPKVMNNIPGTCT